MKMFNETRKIMHSDIPCFGDVCARAGDARPFGEHRLETERPVSVEEAREAFSKAKGWC